jgi:hypothetical protein
VALTLCMNPGRPNIISPVCVCASECARVREEWTHDPPLPFCLRILFSIRSLVSSLQSRRQGYLQVRAVQHHIDYRHRHCQSLPHYPQNAKHQPFLMTTRMEMTCPQRAPNLLTGPLNDHVNRQRHPTNGPSLYPVSSTISIDPPL